MARTHPHAEATYRVISLKEGTFGVEIAIPGSYPTKVTSFATEADAEAWIAEHQSKVQSEAQSSRWFRRSSPNRSQ
jgi:hypothetical protein